MEKELNNGLQESLEMSLYELQTTVERYPFDQSARIKYIERLFALQNDSFGKELRKASLFVPNRKVLFYMIEGEKYKISPNQTTDKKTDVREKKESPVEATDRTSALINEFLLLMPDDQPKRRLTLADATTDYAAYLEQQDSMEQEEAGTRTDTANAYGRTEEREKTSPEDVLTKAHESYIIGDENKSENENDECFTETLAKIYIKQGKYEGAIEIMRKLSADNPKKSCYFADQIRFLEKVVINNKSKK